MTHALRTAAAFVLIAAGTTLAAQGLTLRDAERETLSRHPAIAAADAQKLAAQAREGEARAARFPRLALSESVTRGNNPVFVFGSLLEQGRFAPRHFDPAFLNAPDALTHYRASANATVSLFDRFRTTTAIAQSRNGISHADLGIEEARQQLRAAVIARYYGVVLATEKLTVAQEAILAADADAKATRDRFEQGLLVESDALAADVQRAGFRQHVLAAEGELAIARAALSTLLQRSRSEPLVVDGVLPNPTFDDPDLETAIARAIDARASVKTAALATADADLRLRAERGALLPRVDAFGTIGASGSTPGNRNADHTAGLVVTVDLFDRARASRIAGARAGIEAARAGERQVRDAATMDVISAWHRQRTARESAAVAAVAVEQAQAAARIVRDRYEHGLTTITEHLRAQTALVSARFELLAARYDALVAHAQLLQSKGDLDNVEPFV